ncbi:bifunctional proline dehydrogenase/L-glutamate gamma-semialdehyde dehydrogenase PutA [Pseudochrobactrum algeriensis]|uniref:bifunctional proline dehydrogenase/L-glutamate gamma-semialdehyde dehydrogenase PutA n=1 Tax=Pseudochrobactrum algeriensis TaxID=2834768 RepID=UPI001BCFB5F5|nr:bifunctional proline dehydrogenase/L-glutamate gamma-semialdehyde dehydrogenase PutA [Pseudochrobactrum algeriensis]QVQ35777.1 bifunctional proline dehydrogenase/L-glutamate gamma-semialdehyde dehydrogenase PutA [Pseudochrobactrum algeriensis]QVQ38993.1 bifunctional proline dehydrogenase/L-glutamate gamma-semialdehyde dehydrogenase PutA [Pseudochrobactrum algeriensis]QVQ42911.1 bifunctional proline dehydrogenase/L-glutamate gamma-semialdehyde dehydrogenase PutA [Pseudochrobactrum algeriensis]
MTLPNTALSNAPQVVSEKAQNTTLPLPPFTAPYAPDDHELVSALLASVTFDDAANRRIDARASEFITNIRKQSKGIGGVEDFLREYGLSTREGLALMVLAEALLRVPDSATQDKLIEDKLKQGNWSEHRAQGDTWFVSASAWGLGLAAKVIRPGETPEGVLSSLVKRMGLPTVRTATKQAMRFLGSHFVLGENIHDALKRAKVAEKKGYRHSFDMLGEGARTAEDAKRYYKSYSDAIDEIGKAAGNGKLPDRMGISVKLSALHPRYLATHHAQVMRELVPDVLALAQKAKSYDLNFTIDAEEADRLELSLDLIDRVFADPSLAGWDGFGLAIQAYQKRALPVIQHIVSLCEKTGQRMMVRLVKGAYWDTEVKRTQERGLEDYPVFTRKAATDASYIACARYMLDQRKHIFPQFAGHNALTVAMILEMAGNDKSGFEFQRLHGMGESLFKQVTEAGEKIACRVYAPVGGYRDLLAYLVRRLLENGANSSFVSVVGDENVPVASLLKRPVEILNDGRGMRNANIPYPKDMYGQRRNSAGLEFGDRLVLGTFMDGIVKARANVDAVPLFAGFAKKGSGQPVLSPVDGSQVGTVAEATAEDAAKAVEVARKGFAGWSRMSVEDRATALERAGDLLEKNRDRFIDLLSREAGKTMDDGIAEIREAVDFCRYYAAEARRHFANETIMPGPTGEDNRLRYRGRGVFVCISPWNFPLAIFLGQVTAALAAGNAVVAKPAEQTPLIAYEAIKLLHEAGVPQDAVIYLPGDGSVGAALTSHARIDGVCFTGSTDTAWAINRTLAAKKGPIVPLIAETGGLNAMIVDATALPEQVADDVVMSAFRSAGQRCSALRIVYLQEDVADGMLKMIEGAAREMHLGNPALETTDIGPIIDREQQAMLNDYVEQMKGKAKVTKVGVTPEGELQAGHFFAPHIIELKDASELTREVFGPVLHVVRWKASELDNVLDQVANSGFGLTFGLHSRIEAVVARAVERLDVGNIYINRNTIGAVVGTQPFGGSGLSGTGPKAGGPNYLLRFALEQVVSVNTAAAGGNASLIAMGE